MVDVHSGRTRSALQAPGSYFVYSLSCSLDQSSIVDIASSSRFLMPPLEDSFGQVWDGIDEVRTVAGT